MKDCNASKNRYLKDDVPTRLGNLASNLARIKSRCDNAANCELVNNLLQESKQFIEWTASDLEIEKASELVDLQIQLACWQYRLSTIWQDVEQRKNMAEKAEIWSQIVLNMSGLLLVG